MINTFSDLAPTREPLCIPVMDPGPAAVNWPFRRDEPPRRGEGIDTVLAQVAHDLATPVHSISATVELLLDSFDSLDKEQTASLLRRLHQGTRWLQELLGDLADGRLVTDARDEVRGRPFSLSQCVEYGVPIVQPMFDLRDQRVEVVRPARPVMVWGDEHLLRRVVVNLLNNAAKYSRSRDVIQVEVRIEANWAFVEVRDHGPGVGPRDLGRIFTPRVRGPSAGRADGPDGSGLGLSIVKSVVELHGGKVGVRSRAGSGASFWFSLPRLGSARSRVVMSNLGSLHEEPAQPDRRFA